MRLNASTSLVPARPDLVKQGDQRSLVGRKAALMTMGTRERSPSSKRAVPPLAPRRSLEAAGQSQALTSSAENDCLGVSLAWGQSSSKATVQLGEGQAAAVLPPPACQTPQESSLQMPAQGQAGPQSAQPCQAVRAVWPRAQPPALPRPRRLTKRNGRRVGGSPLSGG